MERARGQGACQGTVSQRKRYYLLNIPATAVAPAPGSAISRPTPDDRESLASLMLDAYIGTTDYDGETIDDARHEVESYFSGEPMLEFSNVSRERETLVSACLIGSYDDPRIPLVGYLMTRARCKRTGLARRLLAASLSDLYRAGYRQVGAWITEGNEPSEELHKSLGFELVR